MHTIQLLFLLIIRYVLAAKIAGEEISIDIQG
jgi:hypothetical protein